MENTIDIKDIVIYSNCPMYYKFFNNGELKYKVISTCELFDTEIHEAIYSYLNLFQDSKTASLRHLNKAFATRWIGSNKTIEDILYVEPSSWRDTYDQKRKRGLASLHKFHNLISQEPFFPIAINKKYKVNICKNLYLTGTIEFVREINSKIIELMDFKVDDKLHNKVYVEKDLEITAACYAFKQLYNKDIDTICFYGLDKGKSYTTYRSDKDYKLLKLIAVKIFTCIKNNVFYPRIGDNCSSCLYKSICLDNLNYENLK